MANELYVGIQFGATLSSAFSGVFGTAKGTLKRLGQASDALKKRHQRLGETLSQALAHPLRNVSELHQRYQRLGRTLEDLQRRQLSLSAALARNDALRTERKTLRGDAMETIGTGIALLGPMVQSVRVAASFEDQVKDIAITGELSPLQEMQLGKSIRDAALRYGQRHDAVAAGVGKLIADGMAPEQAGQYTGLLAKVATATRAEMEHLASMTMTFDQTLGVKDMELAFNQAAKAGKQGSFELRDLAKWLPQLGSAVKGVGLEGNEAVVNMSSRLQIARRGAGSNDEAANNFRRFLTKLTSQDTQARFQKLGIDLKGRMMAAARQGLDPIEAGVNIIMTQMAKASPAAARELRKLAQELEAIEDPIERAAEMERRSAFIESLGARAGLSEMFQDMRASSYFLTELQHHDDLKTIISETRAGVSASGKAVIDEDLIKRMKGALNALDGIMVHLTDTSIILGKALLPPLKSLMDSVMPLVRAFGDWAENNPGLIRGLTGIVAGLLGGKLAFIAIRYAINLVLTPLNGIRIATETLLSRWTLLKAMWQAGRFAPLVRMFTGFGRGLLSIGRGIVPVLSGLAAFGKGVAMFFIAPLKLAGQAILWLGRAMLLNPIGAIITALGVAAYLIWDNWDTLKSAVMQGWAWLKGLYDDFRSAGANLIEGLVAGITSRLTAARDTIVNFGGSIKDWFSDTLGINSPSRVFIGFGGGISTGLATGINKHAARVATAMDGLNALTQLDAAGATLPVRTAAAPLQGATLHFSPVIHVQGGADARAQVQTALDQGYRDFERHIQRWMDTNQRRGYA